MEIHIYIPIWLDLLSKIPNNFLNEKHDLHSNMVRFIINIAKQNKSVYKNLHSNMVRFIIALVVKNLNQQIIFTFQYG